MKNEILNSLVALVVILIVFCLPFKNVFVKRSADEEYFEVLGMENHSLQYFDELLYRTPSENIIELDSQVLQVRQDGYDIFLYQNKNSNSLYHCSFMRIEIYDNKYKFENDKIAVGTDKETVSNVYKKYTTIKDLPEYQMGYIIDGLWIRFELDNNVVNKIIIYFGP